MTTNEPILSPATRAQLARASLADARRMIRAAVRHEQSYRNAVQYGATPYTDRVAELRRRCLTEARALIASSRTMYAEAMRACAQRGQLTHHYAPLRDGRYRAVVRVPGSRDVWGSLMTYGRRQSAQRAAANHIGALRRAI
jgi:hypothetical protein